MAVLKVIGNNYNDLESLYRLLQYPLTQKVYDKNDCENPDQRICSPYFDGSNLYLGTLQPDTIECMLSRVYKQMTDVITYNGKFFGQLLHHLELSFDSQNTERWITPELAYQFGCQLCAMPPLNQYQILFGVHTNRPTHLHIHFIINSTSPFTGHKFPDKKDTYHQIAKAVKSLQITPQNKVESCHVCYENFKGFLQS